MRDANGALVQIDGGFTRPAKAGTPTEGPIRVHGPRAGRVALVRGQVDQGPGRIHRGRAGDRGLLAAGIAHRNGQRVRAGSRVGVASLDGESAGRAAAYGHDGSGARLRAVAPVDLGGVGGGGRQGVVVEELAHADRARGLPRHRRNGLRNGVQERIADHQRLRAVRGVVRLRVGGRGGDRVVAGRGVDVRGGHQQRAGKLAAAVRVDRGGDGRGIGSAVAPGDAGRVRGGRGGGHRVGKRYREHGIVLLPLAHAHGLGRLGVGDEPAASLIVVPTVYEPGCA